MSAIELATFRAKADQADAMAVGLPAAASVIVTAPGCLSARAMRCIERPDEFIFRVEWTEVQKHFDFRASALFLNIARTSASTSTKLSASPTTTSFESYV